MENYFQELKKVGDDFKSGKITEKEYREKICLINYQDNLDRLYIRYQAGVISREQYERDCDWARRNYESGGKLYEEKLMKALTPNPRWRWDYTPSTPVTFK